MKRVYEAGDPGEAYSARGQLWAAGIQAIIRVRDESAMRDLQMRQAMPLSVWVDDADYDRAGQVLGDPPP